MQSASFFSVWASWNFGPQAWMMWRAERFPAPVMPASPMATEPIAASSFLMESPPRDWIAPP